jgi:hypothetical protein
VISTGTGATGWAKSLHRERHSTLELPAATDRRLAFFVREPWPSPATQAALTEGPLDHRTPLSVRCENAEHGVVFGDGIEADRIPLGWGERATVTVSDRALALVT